MKRLQVLVLVFATLVLVMASLTAALPGGQATSACAAPILFDSDAQSVLCCCNTENGMCCAYVGFCGGFVPGCVCSG